MLGACGGWRSRLCSRAVATSRRHASSHSTWRSATTRTAAGSPATQVVALKGDRAYVNGAPLDDVDVERGLTSALRHQREMGLAADVALRYATVERAFRAARMAGVDKVLLETDATPRR